MKWRFSLYSQYKVSIYLDQIAISLHIPTESVHFCFYRKSITSNYIIQFNFKYSFLRNSFFNKLIKKKNDKFRFQFTSKYSS